MCSFFTGQQREGITGHIFQIQQNQYRPPEGRSANLTPYGRNPLKVYESGWDYEPKSHHIKHYVASPGSGRPVRVYGNPLDYELHNKNGYAWYKEGNNNKLYEDINNAEPPPIKPPIPYIPPNGDPPSGNGWYVERILGGYRAVKDDQKRNGWKHIYTRVFRVHPEGIAGASFWSLVSEYDPDMGRGDGIEEEIKSQNQRVIDETEAHVLRKTRDTDAQRFLAQKANDKPSGTSQTFMNSNVTDNDKYITSPKSNNSNNDSAVVQNTQKMSDDLFDLLDLGSGGSGEEPQIENENVEPLKEVHQKNNEVDDVDIKSEELLPLDIKPHSLLKKVSNVSSSGSIAAGSERSVGDKGSTLPLASSERSVKVNGSTLTTAASERSVEDNGSTLTTPVLSIAADADGPIDPESEIEMGLEMTDGPTHRRGRFPPPPPPPQVQMNNQGGPGYHGNGPHNNGPFQNGPHMPGPNAMSLPQYHGANEIPRWMAIRRIDGRTPHFHIEEEHPQGPDFGLETEFQHSEETLDPSFIDTDIQPRMRVSSVCMEKPQIGPCRAMIQRWYYNLEEHQCMLLFYGGCQGNNNNFHTKEECMLTCGK